MELDVTKDQVHTITMHLLALISCLLLHSFAMRALDGDLYGMNNACINDTTPNCCRGVHWYKIKESVRDRLLRLRPDRSAYVTVNIQQPEPVSQRKFVFDCVWDMSALTYSGAPAPPYDGNEPGLADLIEQSTFRSVKLECVHYFFPELVTPRGFPPYGRCIYVAPLALQASARTGLRVQPVSERATSVVSTSEWPRVRRFQRRRGQVPENFDTPEAYEQYMDAQQAHFTCTDFFRSYNM